MKKTSMKLWHVFPIEKQAWQAQETQKELSFEVFTAEKQNIIGETLIDKNIQKPFPVTIISGL